MLKTIAAAALAAAAACVSAQTYPSKPIKIIASTAPGGSVDKLARAVGKHLQEKWGQPVVVDNRAGAGGSIAADGLVSSPPDGYTLMLSTVTTYAINPVLEKMRYDTLRDFAPVTMLGIQDYVLLISTASPVNSVADLTKLAQSGTNVVSYSSAGRGTGGHVSGELFAQSIGAQMLHVPYKGVAQAINDVIGGQVTITFSTISSAEATIDAKKLKPLAVTGLKRSPVLPNVPTMDEVGIKGYTANTWYGIVAPAKTPPAILKQLHGEIAAMMKDPAVRASFDKDGIDLIGNTPEEFTAAIKQEQQKWQRTLEKAGLAAK